MTYFKNKTLSSRILILFLVLCLIFASIASEMFVAENVVHRHDINNIDGSCLVCSKLNKAEFIIKNLTVFIISFASYIPPIVLFLLSSLVFLYNRSRSISLVDLKV